MRAQLTIAVLLAAGCVAPALEPLPEPPRLEPSAECFRAVAATLAADEMGGRGVGTAGLERAARYLAASYRSLALDTGAGADAYRQEFEASTGVELGSGNRLGWGEHAGELLTHFTPLGFSSTGAFSGPLVFAGYGIRAAEIDYDDYARLDVAGRVVLAWRYEPGEGDEQSPFDGKHPSRWSDLRYKAHIAREAGAAALILVSPPGDDEDRLPRLRLSGPTSHAGLPVLQVTRAVAKTWLAQAGLDPVALHAAIDSDYTPRSAEIPGLRVEGTVDLVTRTATVANVVGVVPGAGALARQAVVVGAHYDHLGLGGHGSMRPDSQAVHNGADDNASGVAAMLCGVGGLVRELGSDAPASRRSLIVIAFTAEEIGLGGSSFYVREPLLPLDDTVAMVNLDMVGRLREDKLMALGADSADEWRPLLERLAAADGLSLRAGGDGYGPSDQLPFFERGVPIIHLFTGSHPEYHTPEDDSETLNFEGGARVARFLQGLLTDLLVSERLSYRAASGGPPSRGDSRGYGAYLGTIPDFSEMLVSEGGVLLSGVRDGGPAAQAGIRGGDRIVRMAGVEIRNLYDMTFVLRDHKPGAVIRIELLRGQERLEVAATLGRRGAPEQNTPPSGSPHGAVDWSPRAGSDARPLIHPQERHLADLRQLTHDGENAEAYFAPDGRTLVFQRTPPEGGCDQQYLLDLDTGSVTRFSSGRGRTTCGYYAYPEGERLIYATTERHAAECPAPPDRSQGYVWGLYEFDLVWQQGPEAEPEPFLPHPGYDAEATACMRDGRIVFTSTRGGDLDLWSVDADGGNLRQLTTTPGYDGGAFFTPDCEAIVWRASRPEGQALADYRELLEAGFVRPSALEIFWMRADGGDVRQLTRNGLANFGPYPLPDASGAIFASNLGGSAREFDLYIVRLEGGEPERVTYTPEFDGFPMFSPDGRWLVFASNRAGPSGQTNLFIARWVP